MTASSPAIPAGAPPAPPPDFPRNGCCGACWGRCPRFSGVATAFLTSLGIVAGALMLASSSNLLLLPLTALPPVLILYVVYWRLLRKELGDAADDDLVLRVCAAGCVPGAAAATLIEFVLGIVFFILCFGAQAAVEAPAASAPGGSSLEPPGGDSGGGGGGGGGGGAPFPGISTHSFAFVAYLFLTAYLTAALVEESVKAALVRCQSCLTGCCGPERACCLQRPHPDPRRQAFMTIALLLAASVGFSSMENLIYVLESGVGVPAGQALGERALLALMRGAVSMPVHAACGAFTGLRLTIRDAQRRRRDGAVLAAVGAAGAPQMVMLASGVVVQVVAAAQPPHDAAALQGVGLVAAQGAAPVAARAAREAVVWSWPRVLWPAVAIHGTFDFAMLLFDTLVEDEAGSLAGVIVAALVVMLASGWALRSQLGAVLAVTAHGEVPERVTFSPAWWPECLRALFPRAAAGEGGGYDSVLDHAPGAAESMLGPEAEGLAFADGNDASAATAQSAPAAPAAPLFVVTDGNGVAAPHPALASGAAK